MTTFRQQLSLLLWKNYILRKRHKVRLIMEFLWPLVLFLILMWVRTRGLKENKPDCHLLEKTLPSVGGFEFVQNYICTLNNTCHETIVEDKAQQLLENAMFPRYIRDATVVLRRLVGRPGGARELERFYNKIKDGMKFVTGMGSGNNLRKKGKMKLRELMTKEGSEEFIQTAPTYTSLLKEQLEEFLESDLHLDKLNRASLDELLNDFTNGACKESSKYELIKIPSEQLFKDLCKLDRRKAFLLIFLFSNYLDRTGMSNSISKKLEFDRVMANFTGSKKEGEEALLDKKTLEDVLELARLLNEFRKEANEAMKGREGEFASTSFIYQGMCGVPLNPNSSTFGFDRDATNRFDSLRDHLRDFKSKHRYKPDPEVDELCNIVFERLESQPFTSLLWRQVKPFIRGKIFFAPDTPFTRKLMRSVDERFEELRGIEDAINSGINLTHHSRLWIRNNKASILEFQKILTKPAAVDAALVLLLANSNVSISQQQIAQLKQAVEAIRNVNISAIEEFLVRFDTTSETQSDLLNCIRYNKSQPFEMEYEAVNAGIELLPDDLLWAVVIFKDLPKDGTDPRHLKYKIRMDSDKVDGTRFTRDRLTSKVPRRRPTFDLKYLSNGFTYLQEMVEQSFVQMNKANLSDKDTSDDLKIYLQQFPFPCYIYDQFIRAISRTFPLFMVLSWVYASAMIVKSIVLEKELRLKEVMKVMGLSNGVIWCGWFIDSFLVMSVSTIVLSVILKYGKIIEHSDFFLILIFMMSFTIATISLSFLVSTLFTRANSAAAAGGILFFISYLPYNFMLIWEERLTWYHLLASSTISNVAFGFGCTYFARLEEDGVGAQWDRITLKTLPDDNFNLIYCILMLLFDAVLYAILTWYIEAVFPGANGTPRKWYFFFQKSYWCPSSVGKSRHYKAVPSEAYGDSPSISEAEPTGLKCGVAVTNLSKTYSNGRVALTDLNINFYEGQITSFLGHNGAGKTTTISILTGLFPPSTGGATIYGREIRSEMDIIRKDLGICPQYNVLFDRLTVEEHMMFYAGLKGKRHNVHAEIVKMLEDLGIPDKKDEFPKNLSGGMKRKLSVAIAFVGGSKTVFLDEPTSGVDPYSRRSIWELLLKYKLGRTIILTTHFMDEADILGDRIAIISQGRLKACGSSLFLKSHFGQGYSLRLVREEPSAAEADELLLLNNMNPSENKESVSMQRSLLHARHTDLLRSFIRHRIPEATIIDDVGSEVVFLLPYSSTSTFPTLFNELDVNLENLKISSYGISDTTLEDVFLRITVEDLDNYKKNGKLNCCCCFSMKLMGRFLKGRRQEKNHNRVADASVNKPQPKVIISNGNVKKSAASLKVEDELNQSPKTSSTHNTTLEGESTQSQSTSPDVVVSSPNNFKLSREHSSTESAQMHDFPTPDNGDNTVFDGDQTTDTDAEMGEIDSMLDPESAHLTHSDLFEREKSCKLVWIQYWEIIFKRLLNSFRNKKAIFFEIILPAGFVALTLAFTLILPPPTNEAPREITPWTYPSPNYIFFSEPTPTLPTFRGFVEELTNPIGLGTACMKDHRSDGLCNPEKWSYKEASAFNISRFAYVPQPLGQCSCDLGSLQCEDDVEKSPLPTFLTPSNDYVLDVSKLYLPEWVRNTYRKYDTKRYGGFEMLVRNPSDSRAINVTEFLTLLGYFLNVTQAPAGVSTNHSDPQPFYKVWYENRGWVSSIAYLNGLHNMVLRENLPAEYSSMKDEFGITLFTHPLNLTESQQQKESLKTAALGVVHAICIIFALSFVPASFTVYLIEERKSGGKHLHLVSGVKPITYWISNFTFDFGKYCVTALLCVLLFYLFDAKAYIGEETIGAFVVLLLLYGWASIPLMYPASYLFGIPSTAFVVLACTNLFIGVITTVSTFVLEQLGDEELEEIGDVLKKVFLVFPHYCLGRGLIELVRLHVEATAFGKFLNSDGPFRSRFEWDILGKLLVCLAAHGFIFFVFNLSCEYKQWFRWLCCKLKIKKHHKGPSVDELAEEDMDVRKEAERVLTHPSPTAALCAENLTKRYKGKGFVAVDKLCFEIERGECFGLLGVNGAGKTSTFKMLTGDVRITSGRAKIMGYDVEKSLDSARQHFGYCPQEDGLDPLLNGYEQLELYGRLRGMKKKDVKRAAEKLIHSFGLDRYVDKRCGTYSGGNRRKVSAAIALIGNPDVIFLDEPTSGMDPGARRQLWKVILRMIHLGKSVVLTTHSMEECEALCTRLAIMVNGKFMCLGSLQHLKNRFGNGYMLTVRCELANQEEFLRNITSDLPTAKLEDQHCSQLKFSILQQDVKLSDIFNVMFNAKASGVVEDYSVSQTTLDDIFVKFASHQRDELDRKPKTSKKQVTKL